MDVQMKSTNFQPSDLITVLSFLHNFKTAYDRNGTNGGTSMWLFQHFMKYPAKLVSAQNVCTKKKDDPQQKGKLTISFEVVSDRFTIDATDDVIPESEAYITKFKQPERMSSV